MTPACCCVSILANVIAALASLAESPKSQGHVAVEKPAYSDRHPKVVVDEGHFNRYTADGQFKVCVDLLRRDGYAVTAFKQKFTKESLEGIDVLVVAGAWGAPERKNAAQPAFTEHECDAVQEWVGSGGALLIIADHWPGNVAAANLARRFGVEMSSGLTLDKNEAGEHSGSILFTREKGLILDHPITVGRGPKERINTVRTFTGQSLKGPTKSVSFLKLSSAAIDRSVPDLKDVSAAGRAQGIALKSDKGRVVVLAESAMLPLPIAEPDRHGSIDNQQLALNILHWLTGLLDE
jgi:hypothetical protein